MELFSLQTKHLASFLLYLSISSLLLSSLSFATIPSGTIERTTKQQILVSIPPHSTENTQPFLTSPSGKYTAYLLRRETAPAAGGFGNDFCYIQVQDGSSEESMWESECAPVSTANACSLVFTDGGLEVFDGSESVWDGDGEGESFPVRLDLVDDGDMRVIDKEGELFWRASDDPRANQGCGLPGSPGLAPESPPFSQPIGTNNNLPFGQQQQQPKPNGVVGQQQQPAGAPQEEEKPPQNEEQQPEEPPVGAPKEEEKPPKPVEAPPQNEEQQQPAGAPLEEEKPPPQPVEAPPQNEEQQPEEPPVGAPQEEEKPPQPVEAPPQNEEQQPEEPPVGAPLEEEKPPQPVEAPPPNEEQQPGGAPQQQPAGAPQQPEEPPAGAPQPNGVFGMQQQQPPVVASQPNGVFGRRQQGLGGSNQPLDSSSDVQPLVDYTRYDSGTWREVESWVGMGLGLVSLVVYGIFF